MQAGDPIQICLTVAEWNQVIGLLGEGPYRVVAPLVAKIQTQAAAQDGPAAAAPAAGAPDGGGEPPNEPRGAAH